MKLNRKWVLIAALVLSIAMATSGTLAYLTDRDSAANVFVMGNVEIDLTESFGQGATLTPGVEIEKKPVITNTGKNDAWVWMEFAIPSALDNLVQGTETGSDKNIIHWNPLGATTEGYVNATRVSNAFAAGQLTADMFPAGTTNYVDYILANNATWNVFNSLGEGKNAYTKEIEGVDYNVYVLLYNKALTPDETTLPNVYKVFMDAQIDIDPNGDLYRVVNGEATKVDWNINTNGNPLIYVSAYAMQKEQFDTVKDAYAAYNKQWGDNGSEYGSNISGGTTEGNLELTKDVTTVDKALYQNTSATQGYTINGNGNTVTSVISDVSKITWAGGTIPSQSMIFSSENGSTVTVNDLTVEGTMSAIMLGHYKNATYNNYKTVLNNVDVVGTEVVSFSANVAPAVCVYGTAQLNNCNIYGTTLSELDTDPMWPVYDIAAVNYSDLTINNDNNHKIGSIFMWNQAKVTVAKGTVDTIVVRGNMNTNKPDYCLTIKNGATVNAIDLSDVTDKNRINITIEDGATVGKIIANGAEYTTIADWQAA